MKPNNKYFHSGKHTNGCWITAMVLLLLLQIRLPAHAQVIDAATCDRTDRFPIMEYVSILDTTAPLNLETVRSLDANGAFKKAPNKPVLVYDYDPYFYWFRFVI